MKGSAAIPNAVLRDTRLSLRARVLYGIILNHRGGVDAPSAGDLVKECGISRSTFFDCVRQLKDVGLLEVKTYRCGSRWVTNYLPLGVDQ